MSGDSFTFTPASAAAQSAAAERSRALISGYSRELSAPRTATTPKTASGRSSKSSGDTSNLMRCRSFPHAQVKSIICLSRLNIREQREHALAAHGVEIGEGVVEYYRAGLVAREGELRYGEAHRPCT